MPGVLTRASRIAADLLFPPRCAHCGRDGELLCAACIGALPAATGDRCAICWTPVRALASECAHCVATRPRFDALRSAFVMDGGARRLVHDLKYEGLTSLAAPMAAAMCDRLPFDGRATVVPVPLHRSRQRSRGYNQAALLAREIAALVALPYDPRAARRVRATAPLARTMHRDERRDIVRGAFAAEATRVEGRAILLVDDVATTGATLDACAAALRLAGAASVHCVTWARAD